MKKLLALVLALVMTLGLATVGTNAAYSDAADVTFEEAVDVMSAVGVFQGSDGKFAPKDNLTREQAAKLIAYLDLGEKTAEALPAVQLFDDVPASNWAAKYIAYCKDAGYIAGDGTGKFNPSGALTGYAFGKMILCVLGYDASIEGFTGSSWKINVAKLMEKAGISKGVDGSADATLTREQAAQYCLNALKADMVEYENKGTSVVINGATIATGASAAKSVEAANAAKYGAIYDETADGAAKDTVQLGEKLYDGKLVFAEATHDDFGRPAHIWTYDGDEVNAYADKPVAKFTGSATAAVVATELKGYFVKGTKIVDKSSTAKTAADYALLDIAVNDKIAEKISNETANGKLVEIFADDDKEITEIIGTVYYFAEVEDVTTNSKGVTTYTIGVNSFKVYADKDTGTDQVKFAGAAPVKGDYVTCAVGGDYTYVYPTTNFTGKMTKVNNTDMKMTISGSTYSYAVVDTTATELDNPAAFAGTSESKFYVDQYGFIVAVDGIDDTQYAAVDDITWVPGNGIDGKSYAEARLVFTDGTTKVVTVKKCDGATLTAGTIGTVVKGAIYKYSISSEKYNLTTLGAAESEDGTKQFKKGTPALGANNNTLYVVKTKDGSDDVWTAYTGYKNMPTTNDEVAYFSAINSDGAVEFVYVDATAAEVGDTTSDVAMFFAEGYTLDKTDSDNVLYIYSGFVNGEKTDIVSEDPIAFGDDEGECKVGVLYKVTLNDKGHVTKAPEAATGSKFYNVVADGKNPAKNGILTIDKADVNAKLKTDTLTYDGSETVYFVDLEEKTIEAGSISSIKDNAVMFIKTVENDDSAKGYTLKTAYVLVAEDA